jgi:Flp pilus assembly protein TadG
MTRRPSVPGRSDRGSESVELAIVLPVLILALAVIVVAARVGLASDRMNGVAAIAARDASLARSPLQAHTLASTAVTEALADTSLHCTDVRVTVDTSDFAVQPGQYAAIRVQVWCTVALSDIGVKGLPGSRTLYDEATSPLDPARDTS